MSRHCAAPGLFLGLGLCAITASSPSKAAEVDDGSRPQTHSVDDAPRDIHPRLRASWLILQALPSPGVAFHEHGAQGTLTWQITPVLYSWGIDRRLSRFRAFIVEPIVRQSGSVEVFFSPEWMGRGLGAQNLGFRAGVRAYFPLSERGDGLSWSVGASALWFDDDASPSADVGIYTLFGGLGLLVSAAPWFESGFVQTSLRVRYF